MFDHIGLQAKDFDACVRIYRTSPESLSHVPDSEGDGRIGIGPSNEPTLLPYATPSSVDGHTHVTSRATNHQAIDRFQATDPLTGERNNDALYLRPDYSHIYYGAFPFVPRTATMSKPTA